MLTTRSSAPGTARITARKGGGQPHVMKYTGWLQWFQSFFVTLFDIPDEELEEYRMLSGLDPLEICRLRAYFEDEVGDDKGVMTKEHFLSIPFIADNPLKDRLALCFGYDDDTPEMDFVQWIQGVALFNSHGKREEKLRIAFKMQDIDADGMISKDDLTQVRSLLLLLPLCALCVLCVLCVRAPCALYTNHHPQLSASLSTCILSLACLMKLPMQTNLKSSKLRT